MTIELRTRRRVTSRHCVYTKCWCASKFLFVTGVHQGQGSFQVRDDEGRFWALGADLIESHTLLANPSRYEVLAGVDTK